MKKSQSSLLVLALASIISGCSGSETCQSVCSDDVFVDCSTGEKTFCPYGCSETGCNDPSLCKPVCETEVVLRKCDGSIELCSYGCTDGGCKNLAGGVCVNSCTDNVQTECDGKGVPHMKSCAYGCAGNRCAEKTVCLPSCKDGVAMVCNDNGEKTSVPCQLGCDGDKCALVEMTGPCAGVKCANEGQCDRGICVSKEMENVAKDDECDEWFQGYCDENRRVICEAGKIRTIDCSDSGGCAMSKGKLYGDTYLFPTCRKDGDRCTDSGSNGFCAIENNAGKSEAHAYGLACYANTDNTMSGDLGNGEYLLCTLGCNAQKTGCLNQCNENVLELYNSTTRKCENNNQICVTVDQNGACADPCFQEGLKIVECKDGNSRERVCTKDDKGKLFFVDTVRACDHMCETSTGRCIKLVDDEYTACDWNTFVQRCEKDIKVGCVDGIVRAKDCDESGMICGLSENFATCNKKCVGENLTSSSCTDSKTSQTEFCKKNGSKLYQSKVVETECENGCNVKTGICNLPCKASDPEYCVGDVGYACNEAAGSYEIKLSCDGGDICGVRKGKVGCFGDPCPKPGIIPSRCDSNWSAVVEECVAMDDGKNYLVTDIKKCDLGCDYNKGKCITKYQKGDTICEQNTLMEFNGDDFVKKDDCSKIGICSTVSEDTAVCMKNSTCKDDSYTYTRDSITKHVCTTRSGKNYEYDEIVKKCENGDVLDANTGKCINSMNCYNDESYCVINAGAYQNGEDKNGIKIDSKYGSLYYCYDKKFESVPAPKLGNYPILCGTVIFDGFSYDANYYTPSSVKDFPECSDSDTYIPTTIDGQAGPFNSVYKSLRYASELSCVISSADGKIYGSKSDETRYCMSEDDGKTCLYVPESLYEEFSSSDSKITAAGVKTKNTLWDSTVKAVNEYSPFVFNSTKQSYVNTVVEGDLRFYTVFWQTSAYTYNCEDSTFSFRLQDGKNVVFENTKKFSELIDMGYDTRGDIYELTGSISGISSYKTYIVSVTAKINTGCNAEFALRRVSIE